jgi:hypothetical protein
MAVVLQGLPDLANTAFPTLGLAELVEYQLSHLIVLHALAAGGTEFAFFEILAQS